MSRYDAHLPQLRGGLFLTDGGIETTLIFHDGLELPLFAAFDLFKTADGEAALRKYFRTYAELAKKYRTGLILESATWRASSDWAPRLGYRESELYQINQRAIRMLEDMRREFETPHSPVVISGCIGPRGDGYVPENMMTEREAELYHRTQIETFSDTAADMVCALTMNYVEEAIGIVRAAHQVRLPVAISFTVETDGNLPTGMTLGEAIEEVDDATSHYPAYYMINCAHPSHFEWTLHPDERWVGRIRGVRANASRMSHAELNDAAELDAGDPLELAQDYVRLKQRLRLFNVMGGCCGTDHRHVAAIARACAPLFVSAV